MATNEKRCVLVMDDEELIGDIISQMLQHFGFDTIRVADGSAAIRKFREHKEGGVPFAAVILDLNIPGGMGGRDAIDQLLAIDKDAQVFVSSGSADDPVLVNFREYGFAGVLAKPFDLESLQRTLNPLF
ncbi:MAG: response regulator [Desulforhopalus sp.]